ncbi:putative 14-3-3 protein [Sarcoptes scabiei]|nr:putative 14-3-3 protein [Sarcoptes scabiei]
MSPFIDRKQLSNGHRNDDQKVDIDNNLGCIDRIPRISTSNANNNNQLISDLKIKSDRFDSSTPTKFSIVEDMKELDRDISCGIFRWHPQFLQCLANKKCFLALFCLTSVLQGIYYTYFVSVLTTIEKLYQVQSRTTGIIMSSTEIGQISGALLLTYYGGQGHRPRWIAAGMLVFAFAALLCSTPHYLFGTGTRASQSISNVFDAQQSFASTPPSSLCVMNSSINNHNDDNLFCSEQKSDGFLQTNRSTDYVLGIFFLSLLMIGLGTTTVNTLGIPYIDDNVAPKESPLYFGITIGVRIFGPVCGFLLGSICTSIPVQFPFGYSDLDSNDPNWIGAWWLGLFLVGISLAISSIPMMLFPRKLPQPDPSSYCHKQQQKEQENINKYYKNSIANHHHHHHSDPNDYNQKLITKELDNTELVKFADIDSNTSSSSSSSTSTIPMSSNNHDQYVIDTEADDHLLDETTKTIVQKTDFDDNFTGKHPMIDCSLSRSSTNAFDSNDSQPTFRGFSQALKRLLTNDILLCRTASSVLHILPISGLYTFLPKYLESQFKLTATDANIIAGLAGILVMGIGIFASGTFMQKFNSSASFVAKWIAFAALSYVIGMVLLMFIGCSNTEFSGLTNDLESDYFVTMSNERLECSANCNCPSGRFEPICLDGRTTYLSPCLAGCSTIYLNKTMKFYSNCSCLANHFPPTRSEFDDMSTLIKPGICPLQCNTLPLYIIIFSLTVLIHSTSEVGSMLLTLRCVEPRDKAMALGFLSFATGLFGNVPCPIIYGSIVDSTCLFWEESCGKRGACRLYDSDRFRQLFHGITAFIMLLAFFIDLIVCYKASSIQFHDEHNENGDEKKKKSSSSNRIDGERLMIENGESDLIKKNNSLSIDFERK